MRACAWGVSILEQPKQTTKRNETKRNETKPNHLTPDRREQPRSRCPRLHRTITTSHACICRYPHRQLRGLACRAAVTVAKETATTAVTVASCEVLAVGTMPEVKPANGKPPQQQPRRRTSTHQTHERDTSVWRRITPATETTTTTVATPSQQWQRATVTQRTYLVCGKSR